MAEQVIFHIGTPKSGTTFLQEVLWRNWDRLRRRGVLLPAEGHRDHRWGSLVVREDERLRYRSSSANGAWRRLVSDVAAWRGTALISHEFYGGASSGQAAAALEALAPADVHLVVTARNPLLTLWSAWQEMVKYGNTMTLEEFSAVSSDDPGEVWNWRALDVREVLDRWGPLVPPERVHVVPVSPEGDRPEDLWTRFASVFVSDTGSFDLDAGTTNPSIGVVECELLRRIGPHLADLTALPRSTWVRRYLAETLLARREAERFWPSPGRIAECRQRGAAAVDTVRRRGYHVSGNLLHLAVPTALEARRTPADVTDAELLPAATGVIAAIMTDVRRLTREKRAISSASRTDRPSVAAAVKRSARALAELAGHRG
jgi:hypothetical protein